MKIEIVSFLKDQTEIENFEIDPALVAGAQGFARIVITSLDFTFYQN